MCRGHGFAAAALVALLATGAAAQTRRPTPHEALDRATAPVRAALDALAPTEEERARAADIVARAEETAAELVEAEHRRLPDVVTARRRRIELLARAARARIEAARAEEAAAREERRALAAEERLAVARGALERAGERRAGDTPPAPAVADGGAP